MDSQKSHSTSGNANGNIKTAERHDENGLQYDDFAYQYHTAGGQLLQNRLYDLYDAATHTTGADIVAPAGTFDNSSTGVNQNNNYSYDELGNLIADKREEIGNIHWTVAGKVKRITRTPGSTKPELVFAYGAGGQRISKTVGDPLNGGFREYYIRDAQGNIMATYKYTNSGSAGASLMMTERPIYGSSRIGSHTQEMEMVGSTPPQYYPYTQPMPAPKKRYELTDHLGNVSTVVTGKLLPMAGGGYQADVVSAQSYEPFGSLLPGRNYSSDAYRFGFQGQEKDDEVYGSTGNSYDFGARLYDPRVGRWLSLDPLATKYPSLSPYHSFANNPISVVDPDGKENIIYLVLLGSDKTKLSKANLATVAAQATARLKELGLKTEVRVFNSESMGSFDPRNLDRTDSYALLGSVANIRNTVNGSDGKPNPGFEATSELIVGWTGGANKNPEPELGELGWFQDTRGAADKLGQGIVVDLDYMGTMAKEFRISENESIALTVLHGATHNAGRRGHSEGGLNLEGDRAKELVRTQGLDAIYSSDRNSVSKEAFETNFGVRPAQDNYKGNKTSRMERSNTPHKGSKSKDY